MNSETILVCGTGHDSSGLAEAVRVANNNCIVFMPDTTPVRHMPKPLTLAEKADRQTRMYQPCRCGSGRKYRFCCFRRDNTRRDARREKETTT
jgi:hypothetical protein